MSTSVETPGALADQGPFFQPAWRDERGELTGFRVQGVKYVRMLSFLQQQLNSYRYLEIGTSTGDSLAVMRGRVVCVDPSFGLARNVWAGKEQIHLYQLTSDDYFAQHDPKPLLGGPVQLAFIDGMHHYEYVLRDFMNLEQHCAPDTVVVLHDCIPWKFSLTRRLAVDDKGSFEPVVGAWTGDVWKALLVLSQLRPDLRFSFLDCPPTGLVAISGLNPSSTVLRQNLAAAITQMDAVPDTANNFWTWIEQQTLVDTQQVVANPAQLWKVLGLAAR